MTRREFAQRDVQRDGGDYVWVEALVEEQDYHTRPGHVMPGCTSRNPRRCRTMEKESGKREGKANEQTDVRITVRSHPNQTANLPRPSTRCARRTEAGNAMRVNHSPPAAYSTDHGL